MTTVTARRVAAVATVLALSACGGASPWSTSDGVSDPNRNPPVESLYRVGADGKVAWTAAAGDVQTSVVVVGRSAIVVSGGQDRGFSLRSFDVGSGDAGWKAELSDGSFPAQLMVAGNSVVLMSDGRSEQAFEGFDAATGERLWERPVAGRSSNGALVADGLLLFSDGRSDEVVALDPASGAERWARPVEGLSGKAPALVGGRAVVDSLTELHALDVRTGDVTWSAPTAGDVDSAVVVGDAVGAISSGSGSRAEMLLELFDGRTGSHRWSFANPSISVAPTSPARSNGVLVQTAPDPSTGDTVVMLDAVSGEVLWSASPEGGALGPAIVLASGDVLVAASDESGEMVSDTSATLLAGRSGEVLWEAAIPGTVLVPPVATAVTLVLPAETENGASGALIALDPRTGDQLWLVELALPPLHPPTAEGDSWVVGGAHRGDLGG